MAVVTLDLATVVVETVVAVAVVVVVVVVALTSSLEAKSELSFPEDLATQETKETNRQITTAKINIFFIVFIP
jgi:hypothetical protein